MYASKISLVSAYQAIFSMRLAAPLHDVYVCLGQSPEDFLFANTGLTDVEAGVILLIVALFVLCFCLLALVKILGSMLQGSVSIIIKKVINTNFKRPFGWVTGQIYVFNLPLKKQKTTVLAHFFNFLANQFFELISSP